jgi:hypothetical protein
MPFLTTWHLQRNVRNVDSKSYAFLLFVCAETLFVLIYCFWSLRANMPVTEATRGDVMYTTVVIINTGVQLNAIDAGIWARFGLPCNWCKSSSGVTAAFAAYFAVNGVLKERVIELYIFVAASLLLTVYVIYEVRAVFKDITLRQTSRPCCPVRDHVLACRYSPLPAEGWVRPHAVFRLCAVGSARPTWMEAVPAGDPIGSRLPVRAGQHLLLAVRRAELRMGQLPHRRRGRGHCPYVTIRRVQFISLCTLSCSHRSRLMPERLVPQLHTIIVRSRSPQGCGFSK